MWISELTQETVEELCYALEKGLTLDWKALMRKFSTYYSEDDVAMIESREKCHPAKALLDDLTVREMPLEVLVDGLKAIGNNKAVSIIIKGITHKGCLDLPYSGGRPPPYFSVGQTQQRPPKDDGAGQMLRLVPVFGNSRNIWPSSINGHMDLEDTKTSVFPAPNRHSVAGNKLQHYDIQSRNQWSEMSTLLNQDLIHH